MSTAGRIVGFLAAIAAVFGLALLGGRAAGPIGDDADDPHGSSHADDAGRLRLQPAAPDDPAATEAPGGLTVSHDGLSLVLSSSRSLPGAGRPVRFTVTGPDGAPVTDFEVEHEKRLHLIAVRRDLTGFQHVHPKLDADSGVWSVDLDLTPGAWRVFADFRAAGSDPTTLGADLLVSGDHQPASPAPTSRVATVDGYRVTLDGDLSAGADAELTLGISKDGAPVTDLEPYLGAYGHLVALRAGDLAYLHVHPDGEPGDGTTQPGPEVVFHTAVPSAGTYHLYLDFQHDGVVRTAAFTVTAGAPADDQGHDHGDGHGDDHADDQGETSGHGH